MSPASQCRPTTVAVRGPAAEWRPTSRGVPHPVQGGARVVDHAAVDGDEHVLAGVLDGEHPVEGDSGGAHDGPSGFDGEPGHGQSGGGAAVDEFGTHPPGERGEVEGGYARLVGDAVAAAHVQLGQDQAVGVTDAGHEPDHAAQGDQVGLHLGYLASDVAVQAGQFEPGLAQDPGDGVLCAAVGEGEPELLVLPSGSILSWPPTETPGTTRTITFWRPPGPTAAAILAILDGLSMTIRPTPRRRAASRSCGDLAFPCSTMRSGGNPVVTASSSSPAEHTSRPSPSSWTHRTMARERNALAAYSTSASGKASRYVRQRPRTSPSSST